jgi:hypothetical protein
VHMVRGATVKFRKTTHASWGSVVAPSRSENDRAAGASRSTLRLDREDWMRPGSSTKSARSRYGEGTLDDGQLPIHLLRCGASRLGSEDFRRRCWKPSAFSSGNIRRLLGSLRTTETSRCTPHWRAQDVNVDVVRLVVRQEPMSVRVANHQGTFVSLAVRRPRRQGPDGGAAPFSTSGRPRLSSRPRTATRCFAWRWCRTDR